MILEGKTVAVLGGTGAEGSGLAFRWAAGGMNVVVGSRDAAKAKQTAEQLNELLGSNKVSGKDNLAAARLADVIVLTVPFSVQKGTVESVRDALLGKLLIDVTVPLVPPKVDCVQLPEGRSAVLQLQDMLGDDVQVVSAFQNISAHHLKDLAWQADCDVLVCGDKKEARDIAVELAHIAGFRGVHAGSLRNSAATEALTSVLIAINKRYKVPNAGIRITGLAK